MRSAMTDDDYEVAGPRLPVACNGSVMSSDGRPSWPYLAMTCQSIGRNGQDKNGNYAGTPIREVCIKAFLKIWRAPTTQVSRAWHAGAEGSTPQMGEASLSCIRYRVTAKSTRRIAITVQILMRDISG